MVGICRPDPLAEQALDAAIRLGHQRAVVLALGVWARPIRGEGQGIGLVAQGERQFLNVEVTL